ncbi:MAG: hypothetical protein JXX14_09515 [Deltaproteobacteria bacterium]|nr:hypothetical protein [Deltaproteobacteria bacterium]
MRKKQSKTSIVFCPALRRHHLLIGGLLLLSAVFTWGCRSKTENKGPASAPVPPKPRLTAAPVPDTDKLREQDTEVKPALPNPTTLITLNEQSYGNFLAVEDTTVYLVTPTAYWRFSPSEKPVHTQVDMPLNPVLVETDLIFWAKGALHAMPKISGAPRKLADVPRQPRVLVADGKRFAWLENSEGGSILFYVLKNGKPQRLYRTVNEVTTPHMLNQRIYFVESVYVTKDSMRVRRWRLCSIDADAKDSTATYGPWVEERNPAMLAGNDDLFFFDMPTRTVQRFKPDLSQGSIVARDIVCSPLAVSDRVLCSRMEGLFELPKNGGEPNVLADPTTGLITTLAASDKLVAWLNDTGASSLTLRILPLKPLPKKAAKKSSK